MPTERQNGSLFVNVVKNIATIEFGHPASNSFPSELLEKLTNSLKEIATNKEVSVIILKSKGDKVFCAGASFNELIAIDNIEDGTKFFSGFANVINAIRTCGKIVIGRAQGKAVGGGVGLLAACDYVLASENAAIKLSELSIGIGPFVIEPAVTKKIGLTATTEMTLEASNWKTADWAKEQGLYNRIFETQKELDNELQLFSEQIASYNAAALAALKKVIWQNTDHWDSLLKERAKISGELVLSNFTKEALAKFKK
jgi:methylglutaconyl-CoA hydratase